MDIRIGDKVRIKEGNKYGALKFLGGYEAAVIGFEHDPPKETSMVHMELPGDVTFKYPRAFRWEIEKVEVKDNKTSG